jgi:hypothetical protein
MPPLVSYPKIVADKKQAKSAKAILFSFFTPNRPDSETKKAVQDKILKTCN